jgi:hypothetical protein
MKECTSFHQNFLPNQKEIPSEVEMTDICLSVVSSTSRVVTLKTTDDQIPNLTTVSTLPFKTPENLKESDV